MSREHVCFANQAFASHKVRAQSFANERMDDTRRDRVKETYLPLRTVKYAIRNLREVKAIEEGPNLDDTRRKHYRFKGQILPQ